MADSYQDTRRDPAYGDIVTQTFLPLGNLHALQVPLVDPDGVAYVSILPDDNAKSRELEEAYGGDFMTGTPSIRVAIPAQVMYLTWQEAYNLGRALIDKANEALYG